MINGSARPTWNFSDCLVALRFVFLTQQQRLNRVNVFISMCAVYAAALSTVPNFISSLFLLMLFFVQPLFRNFVINWWALQPLHSYRFLIKILSPLLNSIKVAAFACNSVKIHVIFRCPVWSTKSWLNKQTYMKTETCKLYSRDIWIFLPNIIKSIHIFSSYTISKLGCFFWDTV